MESVILRSLDELTDRSPTNDGLFPFEAEGTPGIRVVLDRDYWVLRAWSAKKESDTIGYLFNPRDEQSALNLSIGEGGHARSDADLAKDPGFSFIAHGEGNIAGQTVVWRRWSDANHLYSDCTLRVAAEGGVEGVTYKVKVVVTANRVPRRQALEGSAASLRLLKPVQSKEAVARPPFPAPKPAGSTASH